LSALGSIVVKALFYKPKVAGSRLDAVNELFSNYLVLLAALGPGIYSASNKNEYQQIFLWSNGWPVRRADNLTAICELIV
jgi:hypothetical protein